MDHAPEPVVASSVAFRPAVPEQVADLPVVQADGHPDEVLGDQDPQPVPHEVRQPRQERRLVELVELEDVPGRSVVFQHVGAHVLPVDLEVLPGLGNRPHAHVVHPVPLDVFGEQLPLLGFGDPAHEVVGDEDRAHEERRVRPVVGVRVERVIAAAAGVDALDVVVVTADLQRGLVRLRAVVDHPADRVQRAEQPLPPFPEELRVLLDARAQLGVHVLHRPGPQPDEQAAPVAEVLPGQRIRAERDGLFVLGHFPVSSVRRATDCVDP